MNPLEALKQKLKVKPIVEEKEKVAVVIKGDKQQKNNNLVLEDRIISMNSLRNKFALDKPIFKIKFISKNEIGGTKKKKTQKNIYKKSKKTRRH